MPSPAFEADDNQSYKSYADTNEDGIRVIITLDLSPDTEQTLLAQARVRGVSLDDYLREIVSRQAEIAADYPAEPYAKRLTNVLTASPFAGSELDIRRARD